MPKTWTLIFQNQPLTLILAPPNQRGCCYKCLRQKELKVISHRPQDFKRKFCRNCALENLTELATSKNKSVISELRGCLIFGSEKSCIISEKTITI